MLPGMAPIIAGSNPIPAIFADSTDGFYYDFSDLPSLFTDTAGTIPVSGAGQSIARVNDKSPNGRHATQGTSGSRGTWQAGGVWRGDGADDFLLTTLSPSTSAMTFGAKIKSGPGVTKVIMGGRVDSPARCYLITGADGSIGAGLAGTSYTTIKGPVDIRQQVGVAFVTLSGSGVTLYWNGTPVYTGTYSGTMGTLAMRVGAAANSVPVESNFFDGDIYRALAVRKTLGAADISAITSFWGTS